jgi:hypothetical protein
VSTQDPAVYNRQKARGCARDAGILRRATNILLRKRLAPPYPYAARCRSRTVRSIHHRSDGEFSLISSIYGSVSTCHTIDSSGVADTELVGYAIVDGNGAVAAATSLGFIRSIDLWIGGASLAAKDGCADTRTIFVDAHGSYKTSGKAAPGTWPAEDR